MEWGDVASDGQRYHHHSLYFVARRSQGLGELLVFVGFVLDLFGDCVVQAVPNLHNGDLEFRLESGYRFEPDDVGVVVSGEASGVILQPIFPDRPSSFVLPVVSVRVLFVVRGEGSGCVVVEFGLLKFLGVFRQVDLLVVDLDRRIFEVHAVLCVALLAAQERPVDRPNRFVVPLDYHPFHVGVCVVQEGVLPASPSRLALADLAELFFTQAKYINDVQESILPASDPLRARSIVFCRKCYGRMGASPRDVLHF